MVVQVGEKDKPSHLVALVKGEMNSSLNERLRSERIVPDIELSPEAATPWYMFNDFVVRSVNETEAFDFSPAWKVHYFLS